MNLELLNQIHQIHEDLTVGKDVEILKLTKNRKFNPDLLKEIHELYYYGHLHLPDYCHVFGLKCWDSIKKGFRNHGLEVLNSKQIHKLYGDQIQSKKSQTNLERYGCDNPAKSPEIQEKMKQTNLERYGSVGPMGSVEIQEKAKKTNLERYGYDNPIKSPEIQEKAKKTNLERYGYDNPFNSSEIQETINKTNLQKYGSIRPLGSPLIQEKMKQTNMERYGFEYVVQSPEIQDKIKQTNLERFGHPYAPQSLEIRQKISQRLKSEEVQDKIKSTNLERYGYEYVYQSPEIQDKIKSTNLERYGYEYSTQSPEIRQKISLRLKSPEIQDKIKSTNLERYGYEYSTQSPEIRQKISLRLKSPEIQDKIKSTNLERYGYPNAYQSPEIQSKSKATRKSNDGRYAKLLYLVENEPDKAPGYAYKNYTNPAAVLRRYDLYDGNFSTPEIAIREILERHKIEYLFRHRPKFMDGKELDFFIPSKNLAIEVNGLYWHSYPKKDKYYHQDKHLRCRSEGIQLLSFTEDQILDRLEIIESMILHKLGLTPYRLYAKNCTIRELNTQEAKDFLEKNHLHGFSNAGAYLGLEYEGKLVHVMSFGNNRFKKSNHPELIRSASLRFHSVAGGFQRLLKYYKRSHGVDLVESYVDFNISNGRSYELASKDLEYSTELTPPDLWFVYRNKRYYRQKFMKHNLHKIFEDFPRRSDDNYDQVTVREFLKDRGVLTYFGAGNLKYLI